MSFTTSFLNVFVPAGHPTTTGTILKGIKPAFKYPSSGVVVVSVFEYRKLSAIKPLMGHLNHIVITNPEVFSCGHYYSAPEYKKMLNEEFTEYGMTVYDVNSKYSGVTKQERIKDGSCHIRFSNINDEVAFVNDSIKTVHLNESTCVKIPLTAARHMGSVAVVVSPDVIVEDTMVSAPVASVPAIAPAEPVVAPAEPVVVPTPDAISPLSIDTWSVGADGVLVLNEVKPLNKPKPLAIADPSIDVNAFALHPQEHQPLSSGVYGTPKPRACNNPRCSVCNK